jgi:hypothetical protein
MDLLRRMIDEMSRDKEEINHQIAEANRISTENRARLDAMYSTVERKVSEDIFHSLKQQVETMGHKHEDSIRMWLELERRINEHHN